MRHNGVENDWYHVKGFSGVWSKDPWIATDMIGGPIRHGINSIQQAHDFSRYALRNSNIAKQTIVDAMRQLGMREAKLQVETLNTWEDEGGATAATSLRKDGE